MVKIEQNRIVRTTENFELFDKKMGNLFRKKVDVI